MLSQDNVEPLTRQMVQTQAKQPAQAGLAEGTVPVRAIQELAGHHGSGDLGETGPFDGLT